MSPIRSRLKLTLYSSPSNTGFDTLRRESVLERVRSVDAQAREEGLASLVSSEDDLIPVGMEINEMGEVTKNGYGVLNLPWLTEQHPEWVGLVREEMRQIRAAIQKKSATGVIRDLAQQAGMKTLLQDGAVKCLQGHTDLKQVLAVCSR